MPPPDALRSRLVALGISKDSHVIVYFGGDWVSPATRIVFTLDYAGLDHVSLLDGGMGAWVKSGHQLTTDATPSRAGTLAGAEDASRRSWTPTSCARTPGRRALR